MMDMKRIWIVKQGAIHKLVLDRMGEEREGKYTFRDEWSNHCHWR